MRIAHLAESINSRRGAWRRAGESRHRLRIPTPPGTNRSAHEPDHRRGWLGPDGCISPLACPASAGHQKTSRSRLRPETPSAQWKRVSHIYMAGFLPVTLLPLLPCYRGPTTHWRKAVAANRARGQERDVYRARTSIGSTSGAVSARPRQREVRAAASPAGIGSMSDALHVERCCARPAACSIRPQPGTEIAYVTFDPARIDPDRILRALDATGHGPASRWRPQTPRDRDR